MGRWMELRGNREDVVIIGKSAHPDGARKRVTAADISQDIRESLERLRTDYMDLHLLHRDDPSVPVGPIVEELNAQREAGRIRAFGGSNWQPARIQEANDYADAHCIVTVGEGYRQRLLERGVPEEKMAIVMNGVDRDFLEREIPDPGALRAEWGLKDKFVCSYIGTIGMASGLEIVLRAARILRRRQENRVRFLLVGDGAVRKKLETAARKEGLEGVVFAGRRPKEEVPGFLAASDLCFVHLRKAPLFETVMPSKIFEAMGMGKAILTGVDGEARRLVETSGAGTAMPPEDEEALVDEVLKAMENPKELIERGERGRKHALRHFDLDALAHDYLRVLHALIQRKELPRPEKPF